MSTQPQTPPARTSPEEAVQRVQCAGELLRREIHKVIIGQDQMIEEMLDLPVRPRPLPDDRRAGAGQDADRGHAGSGSAPASSAGSSSRPT